MGDSPGKDVRYPAKQWRSRRVLVRCINGDCESVSVGVRTDEGAVKPTGTDGRCTDCGVDEFEALRAPGEAEADSGGDGGRE